MRKALTGNRDAAAQYLGLAQSRLIELKHVMAIGGLQQLVRRYTLAGGVELTVASVFDQDYVAIHVPETPLAVAERVEDVEGEAAKRFIKATFKDTVRRSGAVGVEIRRPQPGTPQSPETLTVGNDNDGSVYVGTVNGQFKYLPRTKAWKNSSVTGRQDLGRPGGCISAVVTSMSPDGRWCGGYLTFSHYVADPFGGPNGSYALHSRAYVFDYGQVAIPGVTTDSHDAKITFLDDESAPGADAVYGTFSGSSGSGNFRIERKLFPQFTTGVSLPASVTSVSIARPAIAQPDIVTNLFYYE